MKKKEATKYLLSSAFRHEQRLQETTRAFKKQSIVARAERPDARRRRERERGGRDQRLWGREGNPPEPRTGEHEPRR